MSKILVVEDEILILEIISCELADAGFEVLQAINSKEAVILLQTYAESISALFTDIRMPGDTDGWGIAEIARQLKPELPVIYTTGYFDNQPRMVPKSVLIRKPYRCSVVIKSIKELIGQ